LAFKPGRISSLSSTVVAILPKRTALVESRRGRRWVETRVVGHVEPVHIQAMASGFTSNGAGEVWVVDASETRSYDAGSIRAAVDAFATLSREHGLTRLVAYITQPAVRMGAVTVAMSLRVFGARLKIDVVGTREELDRERG